MAFSLRETFSKFSCLYPGEGRAQVGEVCNELKHLPNWTPASAGVRLAKGMVPHLRSGLAYAGMTAADFRLTPARVQFGASAFLV